MHHMKSGFLAVIICIGFSTSAFAETNHCNLAFVTWLPNIFGHYTVKKTLWTDQGGATAEVCHATAHEYVKRYTGVSTKWSEIELTYWDANGKTTEEIIEKK